MFKPTLAKTPEEYIAMIDQPRKGEIQQLHDLIQKAVPQFKPYIQSGMIGYGSYHYKYASGREGDWAIIGLASQKNYISVYVMCVIEGQYLTEQYKDTLPKANIGKSCIRFKRVADVDQPVLTELITRAAKIMKDYGT